MTQFLSFALVVVSTIGLVLFYIMFTYFSVSSQLVIEKYWDTGNLIGEYVYKIANRTAKITTSIVLLGWLISSVLVYYITNNINMTLWFCIAVPIISLLTMFRLFKVELVNLEAETYILNTIPKDILEKYRD